MTNRSVGCSLPMRALLVTVLCEAMGTMCWVFGPRHACEGSVAPASINAGEVLGWEVRLTYVNRYRYR